MKYFKKIIGKICYLSPINPEDSVKCAEWFNNTETSIGLGEYGCVYSHETSRSMLENFSKKPYHFSIVDINSDTLLGFCWLNNVNHIDGAAELAILIGDNEYRGKGYGKESINLLLDYSFNVINLNNVMLSVYSHNERAIECYKKCGFKLMGIRRNSHRMGRKFYDEIFMDIIAEEFKQESVTNLNVF
ncbi:GNAT family N-acetyltransferase [Oceanirhabdus sp. W0125-5]|uniref:GNAT family N-acetyltransferase n=1 Tax=Oceanirhabdus sp. W0125-5 TaxID=2999116 RepID=UPI0022F2DED5|nr:GNAT family protein [Oceanirhabdus sp. W0125-5]WBW95655.1 GNAT family protein [Oceanirhabdus sp. W0125-5]